MRDIGRVRRSRAGGRGASGAPGHDRERTGGAVGGTQLHGNPRRRRRGAVQRHLQSNTACSRRRIPAEPVGCGRAGRPRCGGCAGPRYRDLRVDRKRRRRVDQRLPEVLGRRVRGGGDPAVPRVDPGPGVVRAGRPPPRPARADRRGQGGTHGGRPPRSGVAHGGPVGRRRGSRRLAPPSRRRPGWVDRGDARRGDGAELHPAVQRTPGSDRHQRRRAGDPRGRRLRSQRSRGPRTGRADRRAAAVTAPARGRSVEPGRHDRQCHRLAVRASHVHPRRRARRGCGHGAVQHAADHPVGRRRRGVDRRPRRAGRRHRPRWCVHEPRRTSCNAACSRHSFLHGPRERRPRPRPRHRLGRPPASTGRDGPATGGRYRAGPQHRERRSRHRGRLARHGRGCCGPRGLRYPVGPQPSGVDAGGSGAGAGRLRRHRRRQGGGGHPQERRRRRAHRRRHGSRGRGGGADDPRRPCRGGPTRRRPQRSWCRSRSTRVSR